MDWVNAINWDFGFTYINNEPNIVQTKYCVWGYTVCTSVHPLLFTSSYVVRSGHLYMGWKYSNSRQTQHCTDVRHTVFAIL